MTRLTKLCNWRNDSSNCSWASLASSSSESYSLSSSLSVERYPDVADERDRDRLRKVSIVDAFSSRDEGGSMHAEVDQDVPRIAIIGAGAGGSSAAYFLRHFANLTSRNLTTRITVFESSGYVGGRSTLSWPWQENPDSPPSPLSDGGQADGLAPIELGASIFVAANKNLAKAVREFNLTTTGYGRDDDEDDVGIWDGERFVFKQSGRDWWDKVRIIWRYGRSPFKVKNLVKSCVDNFTRLYSREFVASSTFPFDSWANFSRSLDLLGPASSTAREFFDSEGISRRFVDELVSSATQVNYGTSVESIHALGALVSLAATGAQSVEGGNRRIFDQFAARSRADIRLNTRVEEIVRLDDGKWVVKTESGQNGGVFDVVILAAPFHESGISIPQLPLDSIPPPQPFVNLHVTLVLTNASAPLASYFSSRSSSSVLTTTSEIPKSIFSTFTTDSTVKPEFNSLNYLQTLPLSVAREFDPTLKAENDAKDLVKTERGVHVVKLFSKDTLSTLDLERVFGVGNVLKTVEKVWHSYPVLNPIRSETDNLAKVRLDGETGSRGIFYVNGMESLISTMETETVSAYNVVSLILRDWFGYKPPLSWAEWGERKKP
ncbi:hypothetical protein JCM3766R1_000446 [Sporobolomyces carnicolor]